ncbi:hypothetical protein OA346_03050 [Candidatus Pelagibacter sp.]|nr:hypothetical protein [Candidatus Pelagibacter sp.]
MYFLIYYFITLSILGYGFFLNHNFRFYSNNLGIVGFLGIFFLIFSSYLSSFFFVHGYEFNSFFLIVGFISFLYFVTKKIKFIKKDLIIFFLVFLILYISILGAKNHDDFPYYHFPYIHLLTQNTHPIGLGLINNGFRNPSSIFFLNSLFYLPKIDIYFYHIGSVYFLGFANLFFLKNIFNQEIYKKFKFYSLLNLFFLIFVNLFFSRLAEYGTDRAGQILIIISFLILLLVSNSSLKTSNETNKRLVNFFLIIGCITISLKPFYLIYVTLLYFLISTNYLKKIFYEFLKSKVFFFSFIFILLTFIVNFLNSSCLVFPASFTCFENFTWSISKKEVQDVKIWYELWSKGGATPNFVAQDRLDYLSNFNWLPNWIDVYFFNKMSDYLLSLFLMFLVFYFIFKTKNKKLITNRKYLVLYIFLIFYLIEWFIFHPSLRYGGYHLFALSILIPLALYLEKNKMEWNLYKKKALVLITIGLLVFLGRNISRLNKEYKVYNYNIFKDIKYKFIGGDENFYLRYDKFLKKKEFKYEYIHFFGKKILIIKNTS